MTVMNITISIIDMLCLQDGRRIELI